MNKIIEALRNANAELVSLNEKREQLRRKLEEHRSGNITEEELRSIMAQKQDLDKEIELRTEYKNQLTALSETQNQEELRMNGIMNNELLHFKDGMRAADIRSTVEYRSAYFKTLQGRDLEEMEKRAITSAASSGGAAIPTTTMDMILGQLKETPTALGLITITNIPTLTAFPKENLVNDAEWTAEATDSTTKNDTLSIISLGAHQLIKMIKISAQVAEMSIKAFEEWVVKTLVRKIKAALDKSIFTGTGVNQATGFATKTWDATNSVTIGASQSITYDDLVDLEALVGEDFISNANFVMNRKTKAQVAKIKDDQKRPIFERAVEDGCVGVLLGYPVNLDKNVPNDEIYFGDWEAAFIMNIAKAIEIAVSQEAGFMSGSTVYRALTLVDGKPTDVVGAMAKIKKASSGT